MISIESIRESYRKDHLERNSRAWDALPLSYDTITDEWLTLTLCPTHSGVRVLDHALGKIDDGTANRRRIHVTYNNTAESEILGLPRTIFCKATHDLLHRVNLGVTGGTHAEVTFYKTIRNRLNIDTPQSYFAAYDPVTFNSIILLEDLSDEVEFCSHLTVLTYDQVASQLTLLAELHSAFDENGPNSTRTLDVITWPEFFNNVRNLGQEASSQRGFLAAIDEGVIPDRLRRCASRIWDATVRSVDIHLQLPQSLIHGDCHLKQWFQRGATTMGLTDWQCSTVGHWSRDISYVIATSLTTDQRRLWERDLLKLYLKALERNAGVKTPFEEAWRLYRINLLSVLNWWTGTLNPAPDMPEMQPRETSLDFISRIATAVDDLDALTACDT